MLREHADECTGRAVVFKNIIAVEVGNEQLAIGLKCKAARAVQTAASGTDKRPDQRPCPAVVLNDGVVCTGHKEIAIGAEGKTIRGRKTTGARRNESAKQRPGRAVVANDRVRQPTGDIEISIRAKDERRWAIEPAAVGSDKDGRAPVSTLIRTTRSFA